MIVQSMLHFLLLPEEGNENKYLPGWKSVPRTSRLQSNAVPLCQEGLIYKMYI